MCNGNCNCGKVDHQRGRILLDSLNKINGERQDSYGAPEDSFALIGNLWTAYLGDRLVGALTPHDMAMLMTLFKIARIRTGAGHMDSYSDGGGYLGLAADLVTAKQEPIAVETEEDAPWCGDEPAQDMSAYADLIQAVLENRKREFIEAQKSESAHGYADRVDILRSVGAVHLVYTP